MTLLQELHQIKNSIRSTPQIPIPLFKGVTNNLTVFMMLFTNDGAKPTVYCFNFDTSAAWSGTNLASFIIFKILPE
jgi:hypothetical protein